MGSSKASMPKKSQSLRGKAQAEISAQEREQMIAEAAYFNAEHRGFQRGDPEQDWFLAEDQIERQLHS